LKNVGLRGVKMLPLPLIRHTAPQLNTTAQIAMAPNECQQRAVCYAIQQFLYNKRGLTFIAR